MLILAICLTSLIKGGMEVSVTKLIGFLLVLSLCGCAAATQYPDVQDPQNEASPGTDIYAEVGREPAASSIRLTDNQLLNRDISYMGFQYGSVRPQLLYCSSTGSVEVTELSDMNEELRGSYTRYLDAAAGTFLLSPFAADWVVYALLTTEPEPSYKFLYEDVVNFYASEAKLLPNGYTVVQKNRYYEVLDNHGNTFPVDFDYGEDYIIGENSQGIITHPQYSPLNIFYFDEIEKYVTVFSQSRYTGNIEAPDRTRCTVGIVLNNADGQTESNFILDGLYFMDTYSPSVDQPYLNSTAAFLDEDQTLYIKGNFVTSEDVKSEYDSIAELCIAVNLESHGWEIVSQEEFAENASAPDPDIPFIIELNTDGTRIYSKGNETEPLVFLPGDYIPVAYSVNKDGSWHLILCSYDLLANTYIYEHPYAQ